MLLLTETWAHVDENVAFSELLPPHCSYYSSPRTTGTGGGLAVIFKSAHHCRLITPPASYSSFEIQTIEINSTTSPLLCAVIYRPPKYNKNFINEFSEFLSMISLKYDTYILCGDYNIHSSCCPTKPLAKEFNDILDCFNLTQSVTGPTHNKGHTLDLILSHGLPIPPTKLSFLSSTISDHVPILFTVAIPSPPAINCTPVFRARTITQQTPSLFSDVFNVATIVPLETTPDANVEELFSAFHQICTFALDSVAPLRTKAKRQRSEPWLNAATRSLRRALRRAERKWKKDKLQVSFQILQASLTAYQEGVKLAKALYFSNLVTMNHHKPQVLFNVFNSLVNPCTLAPVVPSLALCTSFQQFFINKIETLRAAHSFTPPAPSPPISHAALDTFVPIALPALLDIIRLLRPSFCPSDTIPPRLLKDISGTIGPTFLSIINKSLSSGCVPAAFKHATVKPLLKKKGMDPTVLSNFRPISQLPFLSKVLEKVVYAQLQSFLTLHNIHEVFQSGFRPGHSTETALLKIMNDLFLTVDSGGSAALVLLDLTAAFDTIDHRILMHRLEHYVGITGTALQWFYSYLTDRTFSVHLGDFSSPIAPVTCGVPQGSILGPILFLLYLLPLGSIIRQFNISFHCFADDIQLYLPISSSSPNSHQTLLDCLSAIKQWMHPSFLSLNEKKTEIMFFDSDSPVPLIDSLSSNTHPHVKSLGVFLDSKFKFNKQVNAVVRTGFFQLRLLAKVKPYLSPHDLQKTAHAFISSKLDYCNGLYAGIDKSLLKRLQLLQNSTARLITGTSKRDHISPVLASLHWLPVSFRIDFKILMFVFKTRNGTAPPFLSDLISNYAPPRPLRSNDQLLLTVPKTKKRSRGDRAFAAAGPRLWNSLPLHIRASHSLASFKSALKTHFFTLAFQGLQLS